MSFSPSPNIVRLQELKLWQGSYENLIQKSKGENVAFVDTPNSSVQSSENSSEKEWDKRKISPTKPFEQLLEEKLAEDTPVPVSVTVTPKPKKPFLKKGQGLARFRMGAARPVNTKGRHFGVKRQAPKTTPASPTKNPAIQTKGILKRNHQEVDLSPLTVPDFVKSRGTWRQVFEGAENDFCKTVEPEKLENYDEFRRSLGKEECRVLYIDQLRDDDQQFKASSNTSERAKENKTRPNPNFERLNKDLLQKVNECSKIYFDKPNVFSSNDIPEDLASLEVLKGPKLFSDLSLEELKMERELRVFEALEKRVDSGSFCSTNTSVVNLLSSTPQKSDYVLARNEMILEQEEAAVYPKSMHDNIQQKLQQVSEKTDVLQQFLINLRQIGRKNRTLETHSLNSGRVDTSTQKAETTHSASSNTSFSDEHTRWSTPSLIDNCTEFDSCESDDWKKVDAAVNTSFDGSKCDETIQNVLPCKECEELRSKYSGTKSKLTDLKSEISQLKTELKDIEKEYNTLKKTKKKDGDYYEERLEKLQEELDGERKKIAKEKAYFENYVKEAQNRPSKKEREQITQLKQELADAKELLKLKDTKNGATQARLRTQVKQHEKEVAELKITIEKLQKENAKLTASQKYSRRPQEVKMLHEINKNLSKLAQETFKKQLNKSGHGDGEVKEIDVPGKPLGNDIQDKENETCGKNIKNQNVQKNKLKKDDTIFSDPPSIDGSSVEQRYEATFGKFDSPRNVSVSTHLEKNEKTLADGSVEIAYSNGNLKTVSADRKLITMKYFNGDSKVTDLNEQLIKYHYAASDSWHIHYPDGSEMMEFPDGQKCTKYTDGKTEILYANQSIRIVNPDGTEEQRYPDGRKALKNLEGDQIILLPNGQREIHTKDYKRREYPDGTIRTLHKDGTVETIYANGRVRLKDANGVLILDTHNS